MSCEIFDVSSGSGGRTLTTTPTRPSPTTPSTTTPTTTPMRPKVKTVVECPAPRSYPDHWTRRTTIECGWQMYGEFVAIAEFPDAWQTGFVEMRGLPTMFFGTVSEARAYALTLHDLLRSTYATLGISLPRWRGWTSFVEKWPFLAATTPTAGEKKRRVHVLKPL